MHGEIDDKMNEQSLIEPEVIGDVPQKSTKDKHIHDSCKLIYMYFWV